MLAPGDRIGEWIVVRPLGEGGMGAVYACHNTLSERMTAAVKVLKPHDVGQARERFVREVEALASLQHPAIVRVMGGGQLEEQGALYLVMELLVGATLEERIARAPMPWTEAARAFLSVAEGLAHAHASGFRHRDIKPANIFLCQDGSTKILDFGIALEEGKTRLTQEKALPGTLAYIDPAIFQGGQVSAVHSDVYALGLVLWETLRGELAYPDDPELSGPQRVARTMASKLRQGPMDPGESLPDELRDLVRRATHPEPSRRLPDMAAFATGLGALVGQRVQAPAPAPSRPIPTDGPMPGGPASGPTQWDLHAHDPSTMDVDVLDEPAVDEEEDDDLDWRPRRRRWPWVVAGSLALAALCTGALFTGTGALLFPTTTNTNTNTNTNTEEPPEPEPEPTLLQQQGYALVDLPPGDFLMGSPRLEKGRDKDEPRHRVELTRGFALGTTEVSQALWTEVMGTTPPEDARELWDGGDLGACNRIWGTSGPDLPAMCVSWHDAIAFCNALSEQEGLEPAYQLDASGEVRWVADSPGYRLPTEAEWEYAARAGTSTRYAGADDPQQLCAVANVANPDTRQFHAAWVRWPVFDCEDSHRELAPVGSFPPNAWGLHDMSGNVAEWTWDRYGPLDKESATDPTGATQGRTRVGRGGAWHDRPESVRVANRTELNPTNRSLVLGFRIARTLEATE